MEQLNIFGNDYVFESIKLLKEFEQISLNRNPLGYIVGYSGGKDSDVLLDLFIKSKVKFHVIHNHTTIDAPETVYYIRKKFYELECKGYSCKIHYPEKTFIQLCKQKLMMPSRICRFCCSELKEKEKNDYKFATHSFGVRKAESVKRSLNRDSIETRNKKDYSDFQKFHFDNTELVKNTSACYTNNYFIVNPIAYWSDEQVWTYIKENKLSINPLYNQGFCRVGCIGCPMAGMHRLQEFEMFPKYKEMYIKLCDYIISERKNQNKTNKHNFKNGNEYFDFWLTGKLELTDELPLFNL